MKIIKIAILFIVIVIVFAAGCCIGHYVWKDNTISQTFYANITSIDDSYFMVQGLEVNDINHRGSYEFTITDKTQLLWRGTEINKSDFLVGDIISITYNGETLETVPATILGIESIWLLSDR